MILYSYHRNSAGERVRIALGLKGVAYDYVSVPTLPEAEWRRINPQGLMPALEIALGRVVAQSNALLEWLEETYPAPPLLPADSVLRAEARAFSQVIACDVHPLHNNRVRVWLRKQMAQPEVAITEWCRHWLAEGLAALETALARRATPHPRFCFGDAPGWADLHLVPQLRTARRLGCGTDAYPRLCSVEANCIELDAFRRARPETQPDYPG